MFIRVMETPAHLVRNIGADTSSPVKRKSMLRAQRKNRVSHNTGQSLYGVTLACNTGE